MAGLSPVNPSMRKILLGFLVAAAAAGCAGVPVLEEDDRVAELRAAGPPLAWSAGLAPPSLAFDPGEMNRTARGRWSLPPAPAELGAGVLQAIRSAGVFREVAALEPGPHFTEDERFREAWDREMDFMVQVELRRWDVAYVGTNGWFIPNLVLAFQFWIPAWFVPDETYAVEAEATVRVKSVHSGKTVLEERMEFSWRESLDDFERGWIFLGLFRVPGALDGSNWERIGEALGPRAMHEFQVRLAQTLSGQLRRRADTPEFRGLLSKRLALVVGTQNYRHHRFPQAVFGRQDAEAVNRFLTTPGEGGLPKNNVRFLPGEAATADAVRKGVSEFLVKKARAGDELFLYFSGFGCLAPASSRAAPGASALRWLVPYDADPDRIPESSISLEWVLEQLRASPAKSVLILDTSFVSGGGKRSYHPPGTPLPSAIPPLVAGPNVSVIGACGETQDCGALEDREQGFFSYFLLQGFTRKADANDDGRVTLQEAFLYAKENTEIQAFVEGSSDQSPFLVGESGRSMAIVSWR
jgi:hypothetical protein